MLKPELFNKVIDEISPYTPYLILYFQGEPYLNKNFFDFVSYASAKNMYVATSTNAHYLNDVNARKTVESGLSRLIISIDGTTQDTYEQYRIGGKLSKVLEGAKNIVAWKRKLKSKLPHVIFQYLVVKPNEHQPGEPAPHTGDYEELNVFGSPTGWSRHVRQGDPLPSLPSLPRGFSWRHDPPLAC